MQWIIFPKAESHSSLLPQESLPESANTFQLFELLFAVCCYGEVTAPNRYQKGNDIF